MTKKLIVQKAFEILTTHGDMAVVTLKDYINGDMAHGTSVKELNGILSRHNEFHNVDVDDQVAAGGRARGIYSVIIWSCRSKSKQ